MTKYNPNDIESSNFILYRNEKIKERECVREKERDVILDANSCLRSQPFHQT